MGFSASAHLDISGYLYRLNLGRKPTSCLINRTDTVDRLGSYLRLHISGSELGSGTMQRAMDWTNHWGASRYNLSHEAIASRGDIVKPYESIS